MTQILLVPDHIISMNSQNEVLANHAVLVGEDGRIELIKPVDEAVRRAPDALYKRMENQLLMPGLVNAHMHSGLLRGTAEGLPVWEWLARYIDPMHRVLNPLEAEIASRLCYAESLLSGTTTVVDMWRYMDGSARAASQLGLRSVLVPYAAEHPDHDYFETLDSNEELLNTWHGAEDGRIQVWVGLEHMFYATPDAWKRAVELTHTYQTGFHTHSGESKFDVAETKKRYGIKPVQALEKFGLLDAHRVLLAHCVWLDEEEIAILARRGVGVAHNPVSNMKLASGAAPVEQLLAAGVKVGLGTDGEKENNNLDLFEEMKVSSLLAKFSGLNAAALNAWDVLGMATRGGAAALGLDGEIGSVEVGKQADLIGVRTDTPRMTPLLGGKEGNLHHNLVHAVRGGDVSLTMVKGKILVDEGKLLNADLGEMIADANRVVPELFQRRQAWLANHAVKNELGG